MRRAMRREIRRPLRHLRAMSDAAGVIRHAGSLENPKPGEALAPHHRFSAARHINSMGWSCGKPKADV